MAAMRDVPAGFSTADRRQALRTSRARLGHDVEPAEPKWDGIWRPPDAGSVAPRRPAAATPWRDAKRKYERPVPVIGEEPVVARPAATWPGPSTRPRGRHQKYGKILGSVFAELFRGRRGSAIPRPAGNPRAARQPARHDISLFSGRAAAQAVLLPAVVRAQHLGLAGASQPRPRAPTGSQKARAIGQP